MDGTEIVVKNLFDLVHNKGLIWTVEGTETVLRKSEIKGKGGG